MIENTCVPSASHTMNGHLHLTFIFYLMTQIHSWQLPDSMKQSQADLYLETYQVLDLEMSRLREIQRWQASASSKVWCDNHLLSSYSFIVLLWNMKMIILIQLAADMQRFSRPERRINGPTITHLWSVYDIIYFFPIKFSSCMFSLLY